MNKVFITRNTCPVCESNKHKIICTYPFSDRKILPFLDKYYAGRIPREKMNFNYCIAKCNKCSLLFQKHILNDANMFLLYEKWISAEDSLNKKKLANISLFTNYAFEIECISKMLKKKPHELNVLEFGMGWGFWLNIAKAFNFNVTGIELSETRIAYAKKRGLRVVKDISEEKNESSDYIYSNQVFEHISDPSKAIKNLSRILKKNGIIRIRVPSGYNMERKLTKTNWEAQKDALHPLEHINCYNKKSLKMLAKQANLTLVPPPYYPRMFGFKSLFKNHLRYFYELFCSTQVYLQKIK